jgi:hypothetical protein
MWQCRLFPRFPLNVLPFSSSFFPSNTSLIISMQVSYTVYMSHQQSCWLGKCEIATDHIYIYIFKKTMRCSEFIYGMRLYTCTVLAPQKNTSRTLSLIKAWRLSFLCVCVHHRYLIALTSYCTLYSRTYGDPPAKKKTETTCQSPKPHFVLVVKDRAFQFSLAAEWYKNSYGWVGIVKN